MDTKSSVRLGPGVVNATFTTLNVAEGAFTSLGTEDGHGRVVAGDPADPAAPLGTGAAQEHPVMGGFDAPLADHRGVRRIRPGQVPVEDVPGLVRQRRVFHQRRAERIRTTLIEKPLTLWEITQPLFPRLKRPIDYYLGLSEVLGHLDLLAEAAQVRPLSDGAAIRWAAV